MPTSKTASSTSAAKTTEDKDSKSSSEGKNTVTKQSENSSVELKVLPSTEGANAIIRKNMVWSAGVGIIPVPVVDFVGITAVNVKMIRELAIHYGTPFSEHLGKTAVAGLLSGAGTPALAMGSVGKLLKGIPIVGTALGVLTMPLLAGAVTWAVGQVFILHFGSGGTLASFDPEKFRDYFQNQIKKAVDEAA